MIKTRIIPCLLLKNGRCVKGVNFKNHRDVGHPVTNARIYEAQGADELIFLDIEANQKNHQILIKIIQAVAKECFMPLAAGGGIKSLGDIQKLLRAGADKVAINSFAVQNPKFISAAAKKFGRQCIVASIDYKKNKNAKNEVFIYNGTKATGLEPGNWAKKAAEMGAGEILLTNIDKEGTRSGYDIEIIKAVADSLDIPVIASGGAGSLEDLKDAIQKGHASAVSLASILHFTDQNVIKARNYLHNEGIIVRVGV